MCWLGVKPSGVQLWKGGPYWAECNVGATQPEECGYYFWRGDTVGCKRNGADDITRFLDMPAAANGVIDLAQATVKDEIVKEPLDTTKGAKVELSADSPKITTAPTKPGFTYTLREGETLGGMRDGDSTVGDG